MRAQREGEPDRSFGAANEEDGEEAGGEVEGGAGLGEGDFRTYSNHPPAKPLETHAARIAAKPSLRSCTCGCFGALEGEVGVESSWTIATPAVRRKSENHLVLESDRRKKSREKRAVVSSLSYE